MRRSIGKRKRSSLHLTVSRTGRSISSSGRRRGHYSSPILWGSTVKRLKIDSSAASLLPHLPARVCSTPHRMVQVDGAHTLFGKYTLFSAFTTTANANMSSVAFGILFGNEEIKKWRLFWDLLQGYSPSSILQM